MDSGVLSKSSFSAIKVYLLRHLSYFTNPDSPQVAYPEGFQGNSIPIDGAVVARLCHERLQLISELDD